MSKFSTKLVSLAISGMTIVSFSGSLLPAVANAQSSSNLQAQIAALLAQIQQLQSQLNANSGTSSSPVFTRNLTVGSKGADVTALQNTLIVGGYLKVVATGFFGSLTKAAVKLWQAASGVSATGYFGPKSRAAFAAMAVSPEPAPAPAPGGAPAPAPNAPATGLAVSLASNNPVAGSLIPSSSRNHVLRVTFTAGTAGAATISEIKFHKTGVISDSGISGAYISEAGRVLAQYNSIASGVIDFAGLSLVVPAGQSRTFGLSIDPASGLSAGNTVSFSLASATDVTSWDANNNAIAETGAFPINGNIFTVTTVTNPSLATLTVASSSIGTSVTAGTTNTLVGAWNFTIANSKVNLSSIKFQVIGSASLSDIKNVKLMINGAQVGSTLSSVAADRSAFIDASATPGVLNTGSNNIQLYADVMGSPSYNFQFEILNSYDIYALDSQYGVPVAGASNTGTQVAITAGTLTVSQSASTPTANLAKGQTSVTIAKFTVYAAGEAVKIKWWGVGLTTVGSANNTIDNAFANLALTDDAGGQVGTTINTLSTSVTCTDVAFSASTSTYVNCFGNSSSPINYIVPANTTRVLSLKADVQSTANFTTVTGKLQANVSNYQGLTSSAIGSSSSANGAALTLASANLTTAANTALGTQNFAANTIGQKISSYAFTASSAEGVTISNVSVKVNGASWANLKVQVGNTVFGTPQGQVSSGTTYSFSGSPFTVPAGGTTLVDVYADALSGASGPVSPASVLTGCSGSGAVSLTAISCSSTNGQGITFAGQSAITVAIDSGTPAAAQLVMGSTGQTLAIFRFSETSNVESVKVTDLNVFDTVATTTTSTSAVVKSTFANLTLYNSSGASLGTSGGAITSLATTSASLGGGYYYKFHFATPVVVPQAGSISLTLKGDVASYSSSGATDNATHIFKIANTASGTTLETDNSTTTVVVALGNTSNATSAVTLSSPNGNAQTVLRTKLTVTATANGPSTSRPRQTTDDLAYVNFAADPAGAAQISSVVITFSGSAPSGTGGTAASTGNAFWTTNATGDAVTACSTAIGNNASSSCVVQLYDAANGNSYYPVASSTATLSFDLNNYQLSAGATKSFTLRINSGQGVSFKAAATGISQTLTATIAATTGVTWQDALPSQGAFSGLNLQSNVIPITFNSVSYAQGT